MAVEIRIPTWVEAREALKSGTASALDRFVYDWEPARGEGNIAFRNALEDVIREARAEQILHSRKITSRTAKQY